MIGVREIVVPVQRNQKFDVATRSIRLPEQVHRCAARGMSHPGVGWVRKRRNLLLAAIIAWSAASPGLTTISTMEVSMEAHVKACLEVQGEVGVRVGPGLVKR